MAMSLQSPAQGTVLTAPHLYSPVLARAVDQILATPANASNRLGVAGQAAHHRRQNSVPDIDAGVLGRAGQVATLAVQVQRLPAQVGDPLAVAC